MVREFQRVIGEEAREQCRLLSGRDPDFVVACVGGGSNAAGTFAGFVGTAAQLVGVEAAGGAAMGPRGVPGVLHGMKSYLLQDEFGQIVEAHSISAGLDYPGIGPEHAHLARSGRARYGSAGDDEVLDALQLLARTEGIIPALEPAHALAWLVNAAKTGDVPAGSTVLLTMSGSRGQRRRTRDVGSVRAAPDLEGRAAGGHPAGQAREGRKSLVPYVTGGLREDWTQLLLAMADRGADAIEVGLPFSDPMMDGPTIQEASRLALERGTNTGTVLAELRGLDVPVPLVVMTYCNLVFRAGTKRFAGRAGGRRGHGGHRARPAPRGIRRVGGRRGRGRR